MCGFIELLRFSSRIAFKLHSTLSAIPPTTKNDEDIPIASACWEDALDAGIHPRLTSTSQAASSQQNACKCICIPERCSAITVVIAWKRCRTLPYRLYGHCYTRQGTNGGCRCRKKEFKELRFPKIDNSNYPARCRRVSTAT